MTFENNIYRESNPELFAELVELVTNVKNYFIALNHSKRHLLNWIDDALNDKLKYCQSYSIATRVHWILNGLSDFPTCAHCGQRTGYVGKNVRAGSYPKYCCKDCARRAEDRAKMTSASMHKRLDDLTCKTQMLEMRRQTSKNKYGTETFNNREKAKQTCLNAYGVEFAGQCEAVKEKAKQTKLCKYGNPRFVNPLKAQQTAIDRYGVCNISQLAEIKLKKQETSQKRYGVQHSCQAEQVKAAMRRACLEKYGVDNVLKLPENHPRTKMHHIKQSYALMCSCALDFPLFTLEQYCMRKDHNERLKFQCKKCGLEFESAQRNGHHKHCERCYPTNVGKGTSQQEIDLFDFVKNECNQQNAIKNCRTVLTPLELDIYLKDKKLAIEFDGLYWHSDAMKDANYHLDKTEKCEQHGIHLIHVFENEWTYKNTIVKSRIKSMLGIYDACAFARNCEICEVPTTESLKFQEENHLQGAIGASVHLGLRFNDELVSLMTFGKPRFTGKADWELLRFCNKLGYHIPGGAGKLLRYFERNWKPTSIISYADRRWSQGKLYEALGFTLDHISGPNYWYVFGDQLESRVKYQKHKLQKTFEDFDAKKTEVEMMRSHGYARIFDAGNLVFIKRYC